MNYEAYYVVISEHGAIDLYRHIILGILYLSQELCIIQARGKAVKAAVEAFKTFTWLYETFVLLIGL